MGNVLYLTEFPLNMEKHGQLEQQIPKKVIEQNAKYSFTLICDFFI